VRIIGPPSIDSATLRQRLAARSAHPRFLSEMFWPLWNAALRHTIDPLGVVAQSYKETGGGAFTGRVPSSFCNTAGIKVADVPWTMGVIGTTDEDHTLVHSQFANWETGAQAQVQHIRAYAGWPVIGMVVDPRYRLVSGHRCEDWADLGGKWAPSPTYGLEIETLMVELMA
jgi:N-acetylmuramoyl-L-alanine amidase